MKLHPFIPNEIKIIIVTILSFYIESCTIFCNCTNEDIYNQIYNKYTFDGKHENLHLPEKEELNVLKVGNQITVEDTCIYYYLDYMVFDHFKSIYECKFGNLYVVSSISQTWVEKYNN